MKNFALLDNNNFVINISIADSNWDSTGWIEYTRENPAFIGGDFVNGYFYAPRPHLSWTRNNGQWIPPTPRPEGLNWVWDEPTLTWVESTIP